MRPSWNTISTFLLALSMSLLVWYVAVREQNPFEERTLTANVQVTNLPPEMILMNPSGGAAQTRITLRAPRAAWEDFTADQLTLTADLTGLDAAQYNVPVRWALPEAATAFRVIGLAPETVRVTLERRAVRERSIRLVASGAPASGYEAGEPRAQWATAMVSGPASAVDRVSVLSAAFSIEALKSVYNQPVPLLPLDVAGQVVTGVAVTPDTVIVQVPIAQKIGTRDVAVIANIQGQPPSGYRVTNISVSPLVITVSSADPQRVNDLPGFVDTQPIDLSEATDDLTRKVGLNLPEGVTPVGEPTVLVQVNIAAIEGSTRVQPPLEIQNLGVGLTAKPSPETAEMLVAGPLPILDRLQPGDVRLTLDLNGLGPGTYTITPTVVFLSDKLRAESVLPAAVEVVIERAAPATPTGTPAATPTPPPTALPPTRTRAPVSTATPPPPTP